jgi:hypothetical protein
MANYRFHDSYRDKSSNEIWYDLQNLVYVNGEFYSIGKTPKTYKITSKNNETISFSGEDRISIEYINVVDFVNVLDKLLKLDAFNTNSSKVFFKGTNLYSKRSPFFALLYTNGFIKRMI